MAWLRHRWIAKPKCFAATERLNTILDPGALLDPALDTFRIDLEPRLGVFGQRACDKRSELARLGPGLAHLVPDAVVSHQ